MSRKWSRFPCQARTRPAPRRNPDATATAASGLVPRQRGAATSQPLVPAVSRFPWGRRRQARPMGSHRTTTASPSPDVFRLSGAAGDDRWGSRKRGSRMPQEVFFGGRSADPRFPQPSLSPCSTCPDADAASGAGGGLPEARPGMSLHDFNHRRDLVRAWMLRANIEPGQWAAHAAPGAYSVGPDICQGN